MSRIVNDGEQTEGVQVECPYPTCRDAIPQSEWEIKEVTDHMCSKGHWIRVEGTSVDDFSYYRIDRKLVEFENLV